jgi:pyruvate,water dikinase
MKNEQMKSERFIEKQYTQLNEQWIVALNGEENFSISALGGKAQSLNKMIKAGLPVPSAFCVTVPAYHLFAEQIDLRQEHSSLSVKERILAADIPRPIIEAVTVAYQALGENAAVAIRSSALNEDSNTQSFAGQYETYLHVVGIENVLEKLKSCWASLWAERVLDYNHGQIDDADLAIAVVIQQMIDADCAGVLFTSDPLVTDSEEIIVDSSWGLGEGIVSGQVATDSFKVDRNSLEINARDVRAKPMQYKRSLKGEMTLLPNVDELVEQPSLSDSQLLELARYANRLREYYGQELDVEWAIHDGKLWLLQARPITTKAPRETLLYANPWEGVPQEHRDNALFSRMDTGEILTGLMTPLGLSFCEFYQKNVHGPAIKKIGLADIFDWKQYMGYIQGRVYLNISGSAHMLKQCPPTRDDMIFTEHYATDEVDLTRYKNPYGPEVTGFAYFKSAMYWLKCQIVTACTLKKTIRKSIEMRNSDIERFLKLDLSKMLLPELNAELNRIDRRFIEACEYYMPSFLLSFGFYDDLALACQKHFGEKGNGIHNRIKASMNNLRTIEVTRNIIHLVEIIKSNPDLNRLFEYHSPKELLSVLPENKSAKDFWYKDLSEFLFKFGTRGRQEFELTIPRWRDDPSYLLQVMKTYLKSDFDLEEKLQQTEMSRTSDTDALFKDLPFSVKLQMRFLIKLYGITAESREEIRPTFIAETWFYRCIIIEVMKRLSAEGVVAFEDMPYIDFNRMRAYIAGTMDASQAFSADLIEKNRREHLMNQHSEEPPMSLIGGYKPKLREVNPNKAHTDVFNGLAASPGKVVARARVITDLYAQSGEFKQGEILVAKFTDATWTPLFVLAAGVVTDIGSALSHSSIVAREFGIPAIVNLKTATSEIKTGDMLVLDGDSGTVMIQESIH